MKSYTLEFAGSGETNEGYFANDAEAQAWVVLLLDSMGYDHNSLVSSDWSADGQNDDGEQCFRMLYWEDENDAENDAGEKSICQLCKVGT